jgi:hypothetical protein
MDKAKLLKVREVRCSVCRMGDEGIAQLHTDRFENWLTFEALARKYARPEHPLSESSIRRHITKHAAEPEDSPIPDVEDVPAEAVTDTTDHADGFDAEGLLGIGIKNLAALIELLTREIQTHPQAGTRLFDKVLKAQALLARLVEQVDESTARQAEFRKTIRPMIDRIMTAACQSLASVMRQNGKRVREDYLEAASERITVDELLNRLSKAEDEWPREVGMRMRAATEGAFRAEEAKVCSTD